MTTIRRRRLRRANYSSMLVLTLPTFIGAGALSVDLSSQKLARTRLQAVADISAMAGTDKLDGSDEGVAAARDAALRAAQRNSVGGRPVELGADDLMLGDWDSDAGVLDTNGLTEDVDSIQVVARRSDISTSFAGLAFGEEHMGAAGHSTGFNPPDESASSVGCYLPLAVPSCLFDDHSTEELADLTLVLNPSGVDSMGWGRVGSNPSASWARDQIYNCEQDGIISVDDEVGLQNGVISSALTEFSSAITDSLTVWDEEAWGPIPAQMSQSAVSSSSYGQTVEGAIIVFDGGPGYCTGSGGNFNGYETLVGFAWGVVFDVRTQGGAGSKNLRLRLDTVYDHNIGLRGGGGFQGGVTYNTPGVLVR